MVNAQDVADWMQLKNLTTTDTAMIQECIDAVEARLAVTHLEPATPTSDWQMAVTMQSASLFRRRFTPDGVLGATDQGPVIRVAKYDPDVDALLAPYRNPDFYWGIA